MSKDIQKFKEFKKFYKKHLLKNYGKKCSDYVFDCHVCRVWRIYEDLISWIDDVEDLEKWELKSSVHKKKKGEVNQGNLTGKYIHDSLINIENPTG